MNWLWLSQHLQIPSLTVRTQWPCPSPILSLSWKFTSSENWGDFPGAQAVWQCVTCTFLNSFLLSYLCALPKLMYTLQTLRAHKIRQKTDNAWLKYSSSKSKRLQHKDQQVKSFCSVYLPVSIFQVGMERQIRQIYCMSSTLEIIFILGI